MTYYSGDDHWEVGAFINNLADEREGSIGFDLAGFCGCNEDVYIMPRWWGVTARYNFF